MISLFLIPLIYKFKSCLFKKPKRNNTELIELKELNQNNKQQISQINQSESIERVEIKTVELKAESGIIFS